MALFVNNNIPSLIAQNRLNVTQNSLNTSLERLSTGLKINRGADGPAALVISESMRAQIASLNKGIENTDKAVAFVQTTEGALNKINELLIKARSLALDSANGPINDQNARNANEAELTNIVNTINSIAANTKFNGTAPLSTNTTYTFQVGPNTGDTASVAFSAISFSGLAGATQTISTVTGATAAISALDTAINALTAYRGTLGAFQANTLQAYQDNLRTIVENTTAAQSTIRDTDYATEISNFTQLQVRLQAGGSVLGNANQITQLALALLQG
jgi:flagellin